ncbi:EVE domain-containing protein, partial [Nostoc linckia]|uniref:EVE domain-containing protein n=1 Tax=Nostoc linckia TaxID=92942 RepID=UPI000C034DAC
MAYWLLKTEPDNYSYFDLERDGSTTWDGVNNPLALKHIRTMLIGESIVRQLLYGQRYIQEKFGKLSPVVWVPDSFGFCAT